MAAAAPPLPDECACEDDALDPEADGGGGTAVFAMKESMSLSW